MSGAAGFVTYEGQARFGASSDHFRVAPKSSGATEYVPRCWVAFDYTPPGFPDPFADGITTLGTGRHPRQL